MAPIDQRASAPNQRSLRTLVAVLFVMGLAFWAWRYLAEPEAVAAPGDHLWDVELTIRATAVAAKTSVQIAAPLNTRFLRVVGQNITHAAWRQSFKLPENPESSRRIAFVAAKDGDLSINAVFNVHALAVPA